MLEPKEFTAKDMHHAPAQVFRAADKGHKVTITHKHYPDRAFEIKAVDIEVYCEGVKVTNE